MTENKEVTKVFKQLGKLANGLDEDYISIVKPRFALGQRVWHTTPESSCGVVVDARFSLKLEMWLYTIGIGFETESYCYESELSASKVYG